MRLRGSKAVALVAAAFAVLALASCAPESGAQEPATQDIVRVPEDASLGEAGDRVSDGGIILIAPGTYTETLEVRGDDITVRGEDRNGVILDGELSLSNGVVGTGERITVENLTVQNFLQNGVLITGVTDEGGAGVARGPDGYLPDEAPPPVEGYLVQHVTAENNGLYGIYAFNRTEGVIRDNLASGGSDSGIYVGQCEECNALVQDNVITSNAAGLELANASAVVIVGNRIEHNRIGISVLSNYLEAHGPTRGVQIVGNLIADNNGVATPVHAGGAFGVGIGLGGTVEAEVRANTVMGNDAVGLWITSSEDFPPTGNRVAQNDWSRNGLDVAMAASEVVPGTDNCFELADATTTSPDGVKGCTDMSAPFEQSTAPDGIMFSEVPSPTERSGLASIDSEPRVLPHAVDLPSLDSVVPPSADLLAEQE
ncbi:MAG: right-handed parallel beta-helix repeat-containing protein [Actinomycetota bacterium]